VATLVCPSVLADSSNDRAEEPLAEGRFIVDGTA
jgi:hypothetical protein